MSFASALVTLFAGLGSLLVLLAAVGLVRLPDLYTRMQAASKASSLGVGLLLAAAALHFGDAALTVRAAVIGVFVFLTAPVAAHAIGRAAYRGGVEPAPETILETEHEHPEP